MYWLHVPVDRWTFGLVAGAGVANILSITTLTLLTKLRACCGACPPRFDPRRGQPACRTGIYSQAGSLVALFRPYFGT